MRGFILQPYLPIWGSFWSWWKLFLPQQCLTSLWHMKRWSGKPFSPARWLSHRAGNQMGWAISGTGALYQVKCWTAHLSCSVGQGNLSRSLVLRSWNTTISFEFSVLGGSVMLKDYSLWDGCDSRDSVSCQIRCLIDMSQTAPKWYLCGVRSLWSFISSSLYAIHGVSKNKCAFTLWQMMKLMSVSWVKWV